MEEPDGHMELEEGEIEPENHAARGSHKESAKKKLAGNEEPIKDAVACIPQLNPDKMIRENTNHHTESFCVNDQPTPSPTSSPSSATETPIPKESAEQKNTTGEGGNAQTANENEIIEKDIRPNMDEATEGEEENGASPSKSGNGKENTENATCASVPPPKFLVPSALTFSIPAFLENTSWKKTSETGKPNGKPEVKANGKCSTVENSPSYSPEKYTSLLEKIELLKLQLSCEKARSSRFQKESLKFQDQALIGEAGGRTGEVWKFMKETQEAEEMYWLGREEQWEKEKSAWERKEQDYRVRIAETRMVLIETEARATSDRAETEKSKAVEARKYAQALAENTRWRTDYKRFSDTFVNMQESQAALKEKVRDLEVSEDKEIRKRRELKKDLVELEGNYDGLLGEVKQLEKENGELRGDLEKSDGELKRANGKRKKLEEEKADLIEEVERLTKRQEKLEGRLEKERDKSVTQKETNETSTQTVEEKEGEREDGNGDSGEEGEGERNVEEGGSREKILPGVIVSLHEEVCLWKSKYEEMEAEKRVLVNLWQKDIQSATSDIEFAIALASDQIAIAEEEKSTLISAIRKYEHILTSKESTISRLEKESSELERLQKETLGYKNEVEKLQQEAWGLRNELQVVKNSRDKAEKEVEEIRKETRERERMEGKRKKEEREERKERHGAESIGCVGVAAEGVKGHKETWGERLKRCMNDSVSILTREKEVAKEEIRVLREREEVLKVKLEMEMEERAKERKEKERQIHEKEKELMGALKAAKEISQREQKLLSEKEGWENEKRLWQESKTRQLASIESLSKQIVSLKKSQGECDVKRRQTESPLRSVKVIMGSGLAEAESRVAMLQEELLQNTGNSQGDGSGMQLQKTDQQGLSSRFKLSSDVGFPPCDQSTLLRNGR